MVRRSSAEQLEQNRPGAIPERVWENLQTLPVCVTTGNYPRFLCESLRVWERAPSWKPEKHQRPLIGRDRGRGAGINAPLVCRVTTRPKFVLYKSGMGHRPPRRRPGSDILGFCTAVLRLELYSTHPSGAAIVGGDLF